MFILKLLSPRYIPRKTSEWNIHIRFYRWILVCLRRTYCKGAISDTIHIGNTKVVHNVRDYWYEQELQRFKINIMPHMEKTIELQRRVKYHRTWVFDWSESFVIFNEGHNYNILREKYVGIESSIAGQLKISSGTNTLFSTEFVIHQGRRIKSPNGSIIMGSSSSLDISKSKNGRHKISIKDTIPSKESTSCSATGVEKPSKSLVSPSKTTQYRGFEENELF